MLPLISFLDNSSSHSISLTESIWINAPSENALKKVSFPFICPLNMISFDLYPAFFAKSYSVSDTTSARHPKFFAFFIIYGSELVLNEYPIWLSGKKLFNAFLKSKIFFSNSVSSNTKHGVHILSAFIFSPKYFSLFNNRNILLDLNISICI